MITYVIEIIGIIIIRGPLEIYVRRQFWPPLMIIGVPAKRSITRQFWKTIKTWLECLPSKNRVRKGFGAVFVVDPYAKLTSLIVCCILPKLLFSIARLSWVQILMNMRPKNIFELEWFTHMQEFGWEHTSSLVLEISIRRILCLLYNTLTAQDSKLYPHEICDEIMHPCPFLR